MSLRKFGALLCACALVGFIPAGAAEAATLRQVFEAVNQAVVVVRTESSAPAPKGGWTSDEGLGSGVLVSADGKVMTAAHDTRSTRGASSTSTCSRSAERAAATSWRTRSASALTSTASTSPAFTSSPTWACTVCTRAATGTDTAAMRSSMNATRAGAQAGQWNRGRKQRVEIRQPVQYRPVAQGPVQVEIGQAIALAGQLVLEAARRMRHVVTQPLQYGSGT